YASTYCLIHRMELPKIGFSLVTLPYNPIHSVVCAGSAVVTLGCLYGVLSSAARFTANKAQELFTAYNGAESFFDFLSSKGLELLAGAAIVTGLVVFQYPICGIISSIYIQFQGFILGSLATI
ncbi:hypothetical protein K0U07_02935, partial [bacterium]|nr:hypothetical protein [bacterium]